MCHILCSGFLKFGSVGIRSVKIYRPRLGLRSSQSHHDFEFWDVNRSNIRVDFITNYRPVYLA